MSAWSKRSRPRHLPSYGCYDLTVREDDGRLHVHTDTSELLDGAFPVGIDELRAHLQGIAGGIQDAIRDDFVILETENDGYLPGAEIR